MHICCTSPHPVVIIALLSGRATHCRRCMPLDLPASLVESCTAISIGHPKRVARSEGSLHPAMQLENTTFDLTPRCIPFDELVLSDDGLVSTLAIGLSVNCGYILFLTILVFNVKQCATMVLIYISCLHYIDIDMRTRAWNQLRSVILQLLYTILKSLCLLATF